MLFRYDLRNNKFLAYKAQIEAAKEAAEAEEATPY
jgi:hypothetical protein